MRVIARIKVYYDSRSSGVNTLLYMGSATVEDDSTEENLTAWARMLGILEGQSCMVVYDYSHEDGEGMSRRTIRSGCEYFSLTV